MPMRSPTSESPAKSEVFATDIEKDTTTPASTELTPAGVAKGEALTLQDQSQRLPQGKLALVCSCLILSLCIICIESTSMATSLPSISKDLGSGNTIIWATAAFVIASAVSHGVWGRLSDIFGRKHTMVFAMSLFALANLLCGFAKNLAELLVFRTLSGFGAGGILVLVLVIMSDLVSLSARAKLQGIVGMGVALGTGVGPLIGGAFSETNWRWIFWVIVPPASLIAVQIMFFLPLKPVEGNWREKLQKIDYVGLLFFTTTIVLFLVPVSGGGSFFSWSSAPTIVFFVVSGICAVLFCLTEAFYAKIPLIPLRIFRSRSLSALASLSLLQGLSDLSINYFGPVYLQVVRRYPALHAGAVLQAYVLPNVAMTIVSGYVVSGTGHYLPVLCAGAAFSILGAGLATRFRLETSLGYICGTYILQGIGIGTMLQTTLVAMQAHAKHEDRAVVSSVRNLARSIGSSTGISICNCILNNAISAAGGGSTATAFEIPHTLTSTERDKLLGLYMNGFRGVWWYGLAVALTMLVSLVMVKDNGLDRHTQSEPKKEEEATTAGKDEKD